MFVVNTSDLHYVIVHSMDIGHKNLTTVFWSKEIRNITQGTGFLIFLPKGGSYVVQFAM